MRSTGRSIGAVAADDDVRDEVSAVARRRRTRCMRLVLPDTSRRVDGWYPHTGRFNNVVTTTLINHHRSLLALISTII